ncbi:MAG: thioredoxin-disulfide reductase [Lachnospiraceae bacterium]|nr:thioredoxin-disulfide reductase [Lachnospiraceae bacterium]
MIMTYDLIIVGSGPAGLSAVVYAKRAGLNVLVIEKEFMSGGQILNTYEVDNYLGMPGMNGFDLGMQFRAHADKLEVEFVDAEVNGIENGQVKTLHTTKGDYVTHSVILAMGAKHAKLGVPGEERLAGKGVSYCATCDGAFYKGKSVAVVGGGDVALEDAAFLARYCKKVYLIHRRDELRGAKILQKQLEALENVEILYSHTVQEICGEQLVDSVILHNVKEESSVALQLQGVFIAVGMLPQTDWIPEWIPKDEKGYLVAAEEGKTSVEGIFVAGDIRTKALRQIVTAVSDGANAAISAASYVNQLENIKIS